jgi:outer membrane protein OmpA-like peptidoglycan-associated protein
LYVFVWCPDTDGDGIPDNKDACPEDAGTAELNGCPDTDGDGVADKDDACPDAAGSVEMNGCPDSDGDGLADNVDKCPQEAGEASNNGCPENDRDGDGVADKDDACPDEAGDTANNGCPEFPEKLAAFMQSENSTLLFIVNSSVVTDESSAKLKELTDLLTTYSTVNVVIEGHASSDGSMAYNQVLSEKRANSVKDALIGMGIDASRLETIGYGETKPTADNTTAAGRSANRRAQFERKVQLRVVE